MSTYDQPLRCTELFFTRALRDYVCPEAVHILIPNICWAEARIKIARMTLTIKLDGNWSSFQLANSAPPLSVTDSAIAPSARILFYPCPDQPLGITRL